MTLLLFGLGAALGPPPHDTPGLAALLNIYPDFRSVVIDWDHSRTGKAVLK